MHIVVPAVLPVLPPSYTTATALRSLLELLYEAEDKSSHLLHFTFLD